MAQAMTYLLATRQQPSKAGHIIDGDDESTIKVIAAAVVDQGTHNRQQSQQSIEEAVLPAIK
jgi:hypothetical protein